MIKANELRIGNLFIEENSNKIIEVIGLDKKTVVFSGKFLYQWQAKPIPLTEEWLLKFGFENVHTDWFYKDIVKTNSYQFCFNICLSNGKITLDSGFDENSIIKLKYVHQLQNLYFALTGAELTVA